MKFLTLSSLVLALALAAACGDAMQEDTPPPKEGVEASAPSGDTTPLSGPGVFHLAVEGMS